MGRRRVLGLIGAMVLAAAVVLASCDGDVDPEPNEGTAIVSIGDSVASGEGNPARRGRPWLDRRCHRSATAGQTFAAEEARQERPDIGFFSFACSGATIDRGLLGPYRGIEPAPFQRPARPQLEQVADVVAVTEGGLAAVLVSIGANDVGFAKIVKFCAVVPRCWERHFNPAFPLVEAGPKQPTLAVWVSARIDELPERYRRLNEALAPVIEPDRVIITEYFDPTTGPGGVDCLMLFGGVKPEESRWARENVLVPLNERIAEAAEEHGWQPVSEVDESFRGHGICARRGRWVRTLGEGPLSGTLHPNEAGHRQIAELISPELAEVLNP
ncbi:MAG TPA: SGNH/GDSL hydrolase family protein [Solirubrobacterales bacterium]